MAKSMSKAEPLVMPQTATQSMTGTKLALATATLVGAGILAYAAALMPMSKSSYGYGYGYNQVKCGVNSYQVTQQCGKGQYRQVKVPCHDGATFNEGGNTSCKSAKTWASRADTLCKNRCTQPAVQSTCTDTDGGIDVYTQSTGQLDNFPAQQEFCSTGNSVYEFYCSRLSSGLWELASRVMDCPNGCQNGACLSTPTEPTTSTVGFPTTSTAGFPDLSVQRLDFERSSSSSYSYILTIVNRGPISVDVPFYVDIKLNGGADGDLALSGYIRMTDSLKMTATGYGSFLVDNGATLRVFVDRNVEAVSGAIVISGVVPSQLIHNTDGTKILKSIVVRLDSTGTIAEGTDGENNNTPAFAPTY